MNNKFIFQLVFIFILVLALWLPRSGFAGTTGKIAGTVKDARTGEALPGANVVVEGTTMGAASSLDGEYFIINVPPGQYTLKATMLGYKSVRVTNVRVTVDLTTRVDFQMEETVLDIGEEVTVVAERPMVLKDVTSKQALVSATEIVSMPVKDFKDVLAVQAGFVEDQNGRLHVRGGRSGELAYLIDGMYVEDPLFGGFGSLIDDEAIDEMVVLSGTFNAEYGDAMSGVVNVVTKEGSKDFHGKLEVTSGMLNASPYRRKNALVPDKNPVRQTLEGAHETLIYRVPEDFGGLETLIPVEGTLNASLSGGIPLIPQLTFFLSSKYLNQNSHLPHGFTLERSGFAKLVYRPAPSLKISMFGQRTREYLQRYSHAWKYLPLSQGIHKKDSERQGLIWTHTLSPKAFYILNFSRFKRNSLYGVYDRKREAFKNPDYEKLIRADMENDLDFFIKGDDPLYRDTETVTYNLKADITYQATSHHQLKFGLEGKYFDISYYERLEPWPEEGGLNEIEAYRRFPHEGALYLQDKIEYPYMILNAGLRLDYAYDPKGLHWKYEDDPLSPIVKTKRKIQLSPRLGLAHPITDKAVLHFSYGHFFQNPGYADLYDNLIYQNPANLSNVAFTVIGNPGVEAQKTVAFEVGIKQQLGATHALDITAYYKDITNLLGTKYYRKRLIYKYSIFTNIDYASVKGIDFTLTRRYSHNLSGVINYSYSVAKGNSSFPMDQAYNAYYGMEEAHQEYYLDFDRRHDFSLNLIFSLPPQSGPRWGNVYPLADLKLNVLVQYASGFPYTPITDDPTLVVEPNSARMPWTGTVDVRFEKGWKFLGLHYVLFTEITNLFNRRNALFVEPRTGRLWDTGRLELLGTGQDKIHDPSKAGPPRIVKAGMYINF